MAAPRADSSSRRQREMSRNGGSGSGGWAWNENDSKNFVFVLNRQADPSSTTGSIGVYQVSYDNGLTGPIAVLPTAVHDPTGFVVTP
jgi:hypothetical protein